ncbi:MAG: hypothetical protein ACUVWR_12725 [Anaerolineae bacterium]
MIPRYTILSQADSQWIHDATVRVLSRVGVRVHHEGVLEKLEDILAKREPEPMEEAMAREVDSVVAAAPRELL